MKLSRLTSVLKVTPYLVGWTVLALGRSWRMKTRGEHYIRALYRKNLRPIYSFWHGRLLPLGYAFRKRGHYIMSSDSRDGRISIKANTFLGYKVVAGSTSRGGSRGLREIVRRGRQGGAIGMTPDGPRGPRRKLQEGVLMVAMATGNPLVPIAATARHGIHLGSWDKFFVPLPFAEVLVNNGEPFFVPRNLDRKGREEYARRFEKIMNLHIDQTDRLMSHQAPPLEERDEA